MNINPSYIINFSGRNESLKTRPTWTLKIQRQWCFEEIKFQNKIIFPLWAEVQINESLKLIKIHRPTSNPIANNPVLARGVSRSGRHCQPSGSSSRTSSSGKTGGFLRPSLAFHQIKKMSDSPVLDQFSQEKACFWCGYRSQQRLHSIWGQEDRIKVPSPSVSNPGSETMFWRKSCGASGISRDRLKILLLLSRFSRVQLCATPWTAAYQASPSMGFSRQEHWSGLPFPSPMLESEMWKWSRSVVSDS